ncbi:MAG: hypothetical protein JWM87_83 [Candidatus Eremiobacteraeota bacterium]|nr:hypothetical protein [Candidatus Eremiobacteraeota bacterium]
MDSDFSTMGRSARELIPVPALPLESIRSRSHRVRARGRMRAFVAFAAVSLCALGAVGGVGAKIYHGAQVWLSGGQVTSMVDSGILMRQPTAAELRNVIARATFPVVFPVGVPAGSRVYMVTLAPADHPSMITVSYQNDRSGFKASFALLDPAVVNSGDAALPGGSAPPLRAAYHWRAGGETVAVLKNLISLRDANRIEAAMAEASPAGSLAVTEAMLPKMTVLGATVRLAIAERYRSANGRSVLLDQAYLRTIPLLVQRGRPLIDSRIAYITQIAYAHGDIAKGVSRQPKDIAISAGGVRAVDAVLRSTGTAHDRDCGCEILFNQPSASVYWIWKIPFSGSAGVSKYSVDARTFAVTPAATEPGRSTQ